jgi:hypothetical protein
MKLAEIERIKLTANFLNSIASGTVLTALVGPFLSISMGIVRPSSNLLNLIFLSLFGITIAVMLHAVALKLLSSLES